MSKKLATKGAVGSGIGAVAGSMLSSSGAVAVLSANPVIAIAGLAAAGAWIAIMKIK